MKASAPTTDAPMDLPSRTRPGRLASAPGPLCVAIFFVVGMPTVASLAMTAAPADLSTSLALGALVAAAAGAVSGAFHRPIAGVFLAVLGFSGMAALVAAIVLRAPEDLATLGQVVGLTALCGALGVIGVLAVRRRIRPFGVVDQVVGGVVVAVAIGLVAFGGTLFPGR